MEYERHLFTGQFSQPVFTKVFFIQTAVPQLLQIGCESGLLSAPSPSVSAVIGCKQVNSEACRAAEWVAA